jgi:trimethylamine--corrinoid protein Co-methyltransferase
MWAGTQPLHGRTAQVLTQPDLEAVHCATLRLLEEVGIELQRDATLRTLARQHGVRVAGSRVHLSAALVERAISEAPGQLTLFARNPAYDLRLGTSQVCYTNAFGATFVCDSERRSYRKATLDDVIDYVRLADALENVHYVLTPYVPQDVTPAVAEVHAAAQQFNYTQKHVAVGVPTAEFLDAIWEMGQLAARAAGVDGPLYSLGCTINSPLVYSAEMLSKMEHAAQRNVPLRIVCGALAGATAPVTLAGALVLQNAEVLAGITLCQLISPGCPVVYGTFVGGADMRTGKWAAAGPEMSLITAASAQLCRKYDIPLGYGTGGVTDARVPDVRAGLEKGLTNLAAALCGVEVIHDGVSGLMAGGMAVSLEQLIIDNEIAHWINRLLRGIEVDENTLALDVIKQVGPGGQFLDQDHTANWFRREHYLSPLMGREYTLEWPIGDQADIVALARDRVQDMLATHHVAPLDASTRRSMETILTKLGTHRPVM